MASPARLATTLPSLDLLSAELIAKAGKLAKEIGTAKPDQRGMLIRDVVTGVRVADAGVTTTLRLAGLGLADHVATIVTPASIGRTKARLALVVPGHAAVNPDHSLIGGIAQARAWLADLTSGQQPSLHQLAQASGVTPAYVRRLIGAAFLAPDLVARIVEGRQPRWLTLARLTDMLPLPSDWAAQRSLFAARN